MSATPRRPEAQKETLLEFEHRLKQEAKQLASKFKNIKPTRYLLK